jgi:glycosyltransferase involved in cell wall biosynthesis
MVHQKTRLDADTSITPPNEQESIQGSQWIALLGRCDEPTDGVEDYCKSLGQALAERGFSLTLVRLPWAERGWLPAIRWLWKESAGWSGRWILLQYTALSWSRRGFPLGLLLVVFLLRRRNASMAVVFHDPSAYGGDRPVDHVRRGIQHFVMRRIYTLADRAILPVSSAHLPWLVTQQEKAVFIPVGSNIPTPLERPEAKVHLDRRLDTRTIAVFGITPGEAGRREMRDIRTLVQAAAKCTSRIHLCAFGRGTLEAEPELSQLFSSTGIQLSVLGLLPAEQIGDILANSDVQVDVRASLSSRRGSAIAGIVCGTPVIGFESPETDNAIREAGVVLFPPGDLKELAAAITRILSDDSFREELRQRNRIATEKYFSWKAISGRLLDSLQGVNTAILS